MALETYRKKRNFAVTPEPRGRGKRRTGKDLTFIVQKHRASRLHYDFRLELDGVLLSWAVPKGPSVDPADKRLAMHTEDHPLEYGEFEGVIPKGEYGGGTVLLWDRGTWHPEGDAGEAYRKGKLSFRLEGEKLKGAWTLVRARGAKNEDGKAWFLIKADDDHAQRGDGTRLVDDKPRSVASSRDLDDIAADPDRVWHSNRSVADNVRAGAVERKKPVLGLAKVAGARKATLPAKLSPQLATLVKAPPGGEGWIHEIKYDGYRMVCRISGAEARMYSRNGKEWTAQFATVARALARLPVKEAWVDGEVVVMGEDGRTSFQALQTALSEGDASRLVFFAFDLVHVDGYDLTHTPLVARKELLERILEGQPSILRYSEHFERPGDEVYAQACKLALEGIVSKRSDAPYQGRRTPSWMKVKCALRQEMVVGGYTDPGGARNGFGALLLGVHDDDGNLRYCGKVGTGFNEVTLASLATKLAALEQKTPAFSNPPRGYEAKGAHWVKPELVAEIAFTEWTRDGTVRHPSFQGLRADKKPAEVVLEMPVETAPPAAPAKASGPAASVDGKKANAAAKRPAGKTPRNSAKKAAKKPAGKVAKKSAGKVAKKSAGKVAKKSARKVAKQPAGDTDPEAAPAARKAPDPSKARRDVSRDAPEVKAGERGRGAGAKAKTKTSADSSAARFAGITISHPDKVLYPETGFTKRDLAAYYAAIGEWMLPHVLDRPLTLVRCPEGWTKQCFYQKQVMPGTPEVIERVAVEVSEGRKQYMMANSVPAIVALSQMGVLEFHVWGSTRQHLLRPDRLVFDFDPDEDLDWDPIVDGVQALHALLDNVGLQSFLKTTGGKGLHVVVPIEPAYDWEVVKAFTKAVADLLVRASPDRFTSKLAKSRREGRIFIDYLRNGEGATAIAAYSARAKKGAPVSTPIAWEELATDVRFDRFNIRNLPARLERMSRDPWEGFARARRQAITPALLAKLGVRGA